VSVTVTPSTEQGVFWIQGANTTVLARWTGATQRTAPVVLEQKSSKYGVIGERASVVINGILYGLSSGKTLYRINVNGQVDDTFGDKVKYSLSGFTSTTVLSFDEANNSLVVSDNNTSYEFQLDHEVWSSKVTTTLTNGISDLFTMNGKLYLSTYNSGSAVFNIYEWDAGANVNWTIVTAFQNGGSKGYKDIIGVDVIVSTGNNSNPTISLAAYKDYSDDSSFSLGNLTVPSDETQFSKNLWLESLEYRSMALIISGTLAGTIIHACMMEIDHHVFEAT